jgi:hypothetical protein
MNAVLLAIIVAGVSVDLTIDGPSEPIETRETCQLFVNGLEEAQLNSAYAGHFPREGTQFVAARTWGGRPFIWFNAQDPGKYLIEVIDFEGRRRAEAIVVVEGENGPDPTPDPDPPNEGSRYLVVIEESSQRTPQLSNLLLRLRSSDYLEENDHNLLIADQDGTNEQGQPIPSLKPYLDRAQEEPALPILFIVDGDSSPAEVYYQGPVPNTYQETIELLKRYGG